MAIPSKARLRLVLGATIFLRVAGSVYSLRAMKTFFAVFCALAIAGN
jgi:hypothetical protein